MACIWATHLELTWGVYAARSLVDEMTEGAIKELRPEFCHRLEEIISRSVYSHTEHRTISSDNEDESLYPPTNNSDQKNDSQATPSKAPLRDTASGGSSHPMCEHFPRNKSLHTPRGKSLLLLLLHRKTLVQCLPHDR